MEKKKRPTSKKRARKGHFSNSTDSQVFGNVFLQPVVEKILKSNLDFFICLQLEVGERSGNQIMDEMARKFSSPVSQAKIYRMLDQMAGNDRVLKRSGKGREMLYSLLPETAKEFQSQKEHFLGAIQYFQAMVLASRSPEEVDDAQLRLAHFSSESVE